MSEVQHYAYALEQAPSRFGYLQPYRGQRLDHARAVDLVDGLLSDAWKEVTLETRQPSLVMPGLPTIP